MLYVFLGTDTTRVRQEAFTFTDTLKSEHTETIKISEAEYIEGSVLECARGVGLFKTEEVIILDTPSESEPFWAEVFNLLKDIQQSPNHFVLIEGALDAGTKKTVAKHAEKVQEIKTNKEEFQIFAFTDALLRRDRKSLWLLYMEAKKIGKTNEEIIGILFWQIKILRLVARTRTPEEAGQKPFPYKKAKQALAKFKEREVDELSRSLVRLYHDGHGGKIDLDLGLERWILSL